MEILALLDALDTALKKVGGSVASKKEVSRTLKVVLSCSDCEKFTWAEIFRQRLNVASDVLPALKRESYVRVLSDYIEKKKTKARVPNVERGIRAATTLLEYLRTHTLDTDNCLIGLHPSEFVKTNCCWPLLNKRQSNRASVREPKALDLSLEGLTQQILSWSEKVGNNNTEELFSSIRSIAEALRSRQLFAVGDLVIANCTNEEGEEANKLVYGRVMKQVDQVAMVSMDPSEVVPPKPVAVEDVVVFPKGLYYCLSNTQKMKFLVEDPVDKLFSELSHHVNACVVRTILGQSDLLSRIARQKITFEDADLVKKALQGLESMKQALEVEDTISPAFNALKEIETHVTMRIKLFKRTLKPETLFVSTRTNYRDVLKGINTRQLVLSFIGAHTEECNSALRVLELQRQALRSGSRKRRLMEWWLDYVHNAVVAYLEEREFDFDAMSDHYIESPPKSLPGVRNNLALIRAILSTPENDNYNLLPWTKQLVSHIYMQIDKLFQQLMFLIIEQLNEVTTRRRGAIGEMIRIGPAASLLVSPVSTVAIEEFLNSKDKSSQKKIIDSLRDCAKTIHESSPQGSPTFSSQGNTFGGESLSWMKDAFKDVEYILQMKQLDEDFSMQQLMEMTETVTQSNTKPQQNGTILSISGLTVNTFLRFEKELSTSLELWDNSSQSRQFRQKKLIGFFGSEVLPSLNNPNSNSGGIGSRIKKNLNIFFGESGIGEEVAVMKNKKLSSFFGVQEEGGNEQSSVKKTFSSKSLRKVTSSLGSSSAKDIPLNGNRETAHSITFPSPSSVASSSSSSSSSSGYSWLKRSPTTSPQ